MTFWVGTFLPGKNSRFILFDNEAQAKCFLQNDRRKTEICLIRHSHLNQLNHN